MLTILVWFVEFQLNIHTDDAFNQQLLKIIAFHSMFNNFLGLVSPLVMLWAFMLMRMQSGDVKLSNLEIRVMARYIITYIFFIPTMLFNFFNWFSLLVLHTTDVTIDDQILNIFLYFVILIPVTRIFEQKIFAAI